MTDAQIERGQEWLGKLLSLMSMPSEVHCHKVDSTEEDRAGCWLTIDETLLQPEQIEQLIGPQGAAIDAIQYLANMLLNIDVDSQNQQAFTVELNGYRRQRQAELRSLAMEAAEQVRTTGEEVVLKALSSAERRQIHTLLQNEADLMTESRGQEPERRLVVKQKS